MERILRVEPLAPIEYTIGAEEQVYMEEYPIFLGFLSDMDTLYDLLQAALKEENACVFRRFRIQKLGPTRQGLLEANVTVSALLFPKKLDELTWPAQAGSRAINPHGI